MEFVSKIVFFLGAIGVFNSLLISAYFLLSKSYKIVVNRIFGIFLLVLSLRVLKSLFYSFSTEEPLFFLQSGPAFFLLIGPLFFSYIANATKPDLWWAKQWKIHITFWLFVIVFLILIVPFSSHVKWNKTILLPLANVQWLCYIFGAVYFLRSAIKNYSRTTRYEKWLLFLSLSIFTLWSVYFFTDFEFFVIGSITFSILFYSFFLYFIFNKKSASIIFKGTMKIKSFVDDEANQLIDRLHILMKEKELYADANLKSSDVAQELDISTHEFSRLVNGNIGKSFTDYINEYRVEEAKRLIVLNSKYTIEAIGNMSGFNSKSAFYKAFKKYEGITPAKYKT